MIARAAPVAYLVAALRARVKGPGGYYNGGNALGLVVGVAIQIATVPAGSHEGSAVTTAMMGYFAGSHGTVALTLATLVFFLGGEAYHAHGQGRMRPIRPSTVWATSCQVQVPSDSALPSCCSAIPYWRRLPACCMRWVNSAAPFIGRARRFRCGRPPGPIPSVVQCSPAGCRQCWRQPWPSVGPCGRSGQAVLRGARHATDFAGLLPSVDQSGSAAARRAEQGASRDFHMLKNDCFENAHS